MSANPGKRIANAIPAPLMDLLSKLEYLAMIPEGEKPCIRDMTFVSADSWSGAYKRVLQGEGRHNTMLYIKSVLQQAIDAITEYADTEFLSYLVNTLSRVRTGLTHLRTTYADHPSIIADLNVCMANLNIQLVKNKEKLDGHGLAHT